MDDARRERIEILYGALAWAIRQRILAEGRRMAELPPDEVPEEPETLEQIREFLRTTKTDE